MAIIGGIPHFQTFLFVTEDSTAPQHSTGWGHFSTRNFIKALGNALGRYQAWTLKGSGHFLSQNLPKNQGQNLGKPSRTIIKSSKIRSYLSFESFFAHQCDTKKPLKLDFCDGAKLRVPRNWWIFLPCGQIRTSPGLSYLANGPAMVWRWSKRSKSSPSDYMIVTYIEHI